MAITLEGLQALLQTENARIYTDGARSLIYPFAHGGQSYTVVIDITEEGEYVQFTVPYLLSLADVADRASVLEALLDLNRRLKMLKFCYDPSDGEVSATIEVALEDGSLTEQQAHRCMYVMTDIAMRERDNLRTLISTGVYPCSGNPAFEEVVSRLIDAPDGSNAQPEPQLELE